MKFVDEVRIYVKAGDGGDGAIAWRREKFIPKGGPAGGDGGDGGDVVLEVDPQLSTLLDYRYIREHKAQERLQGARPRHERRRRPALVLRVPPGTLVRDADTGEILADMGAGLPALRHRQGRPRRPGQHQLRHLDQPGAALRAGGDQGRGEEPPARAQAAGRRRHRRLPQRRQVDAHQRHQPGPAQDRRLPVHHADAQPRRGPVARRAQLRGGRHPRADRGGPRGRRPRPPVPAPRRALPRAGPPRGRGQRRRPGATRPPTSPPSTAS